MYDILKQRFFVLFSLKLAKWSPGKTNLVRTAPAQIESCLDETQKQQLCLDETQKKRPCQDETWKQTALS
jgi:hypothetical protein